MIGRGTFGIIYKAVDLTTKVRVALKVFKHEEDPSKELTIAEHFSKSPSIVKLYEVLEFKDFGNKVFKVMSMELMYYNLDEVMNSFRSKRNIIPKPEEDLCEYFPWFNDKP